MCDDSKVLTKQLSQRFLNTHQDIDIISIWVKVMLHEPRKNVNSFDMQYYLCLVRVSVKAKYSTDSCK